MNILFLLTPKAELTYLGSDFTLRQAMEKLEYHRFNVIPVIDKDGKYVDTLSEGDLLYYFRQNQIPFDLWSKIPLTEVARHRSYKPLRISASIEDLYPLIVAQNFVPLVDDQGIFIGIITRKAVMNYLLKNRG